MLREAIFFPDPSKKEEKLAELEPIFANFFDDFGKTGDVAMVLVTDDGLSGAVWTRLYTQEKHSFGFVDETTPELGIAVKEKYRDKGIGAEMIERLLKKLADEGFDNVSLSVDRRNPAAKLYERLGFIIHSEDKTSYIMLKRL